MQCELGWITPKDFNRFLKIVNHSLSDLPGLEAVFGVFHTVLKGWNEDITEALANGDQSGRHEPFELEPANFGRMFVIPCTPQEWILNLIGFFCSIFSRSRELTPVITINISSAEVGMGLPFWSRAHRVILQERKWF